MLNTFINMVPCLLYMKDVDDGLRYVLVNEQAYKWPGVERDNIIGHTDAEAFGHIPAFDIGKERAYDMETIEKGYLEHDIAIEMNGEKRTWHTIRSVIKTQTGHRYLLSVSLDVSQLHTNIEKLEATIKETSPNRRFHYARLPSAVRLSARHPKTNGTRRITEFQAAQSPLNLVAAALTLVLADNALALLVG